MTDDASRLLALYEQLDEMHTWRGWHWWPDAPPFEVIVGAILVQRTTWTNVEKALAVLRQRGALDFAAMDALPHEELEQLVRHSGQFRQKARKLRAFIDLANRHGSLDALLNLPAVELREELLSTWGIGPETADCIVLYAAKQPAFVIDAYTIRISSRLGFGPAHTNSYDTWQRFYVDKLPRDTELWARFHALLTLHAKHLCVARNPRCGECALASQCSFAGAAPIQSPPDA
jgi:endonuclease III related protein